MNKHNNRRDLVFPVDHKLTHAATLPTAERMLGLLGGPMRYCREVSGRYCLGYFHCELRSWTERFLTLLATFKWSYIGIGIDSHCSCGILATTVPCYILEILYFVSAAASYLGHRFRGFHHGCLALFISGLQWDRTSLCGVRGRRKLIISR